VPTTIAIQNAASFKQNNAMSKPKYIVAFDFDYCLMKDHWWITYKNTAIDGIPDAKLLDFGHATINTLLTNLVSNPDVIVAIASFGRKDIINKVLRTANIIDKDKIFITTPGDFRQPYGTQKVISEGVDLGDKNPQLKFIADTFFGITTPEKMIETMNKIIFFDDSQKNITNANHIGVNAHRAKPFEIKDESLIFKHIGTHVIPSTAPIQEDEGFYDWFHGIITRTNAEVLLSNAKEGDFLVRVVDSHNGYALSVNIQGVVRHFKINHNIETETETETYSVGDRLVFNSLNDIVVHFKGNPITDGVKLINPFPKD
jgi:hypothetical protein